VHQVNKGSLAAIANGLCCPKDWPESRPSTSLTIHIRPCYSPNTTDSGEGCTDLSNSSNFWMYSQT